MATPTSVPADDGAADGLVGRPLPSLALPSTDGTTVDLASLSGSGSDSSSGGRTVLYAYPMTARPGVALPEDWDTIPGARGCTPEACSFRDHQAELAELGAAVYGLSAQDTDYQREAVERLHLPFAMLSDPDLRVAEALGLPTFSSAGQRLYARLTMIVSGGRIEHVFYPVFPPEGHADEVLRWLRAHPSS
jgi:peroxiredoxin